MRLLFAKVGAFVSLLLLFVAIAPWVLVWPTMAWRNRLSLLADVQGWAAATKRRSRSPAFHLHIFPSLGKKSLLKRCRPRLK